MARDFLDFAKRERAGEDLVKARVRYHRATLAARVTAEAAERAGAG